MNQLPSLQLIFYFWRGRITCAACARNHCPRTAETCASLYHIPWVANAMAESSAPRTSAGAGAGAGAGTTASSGKQAGSATIGAALAVRTCRCCLPPHLPRQTWAVTCCVVLHACLQVDGLRVVEVAGAGRGIEVRSPPRCLCTCDGGSSPACNVTRVACV